MNLSWKCWTHVLIFISALLLWTSHRAHTTLLLEEDNSQDNTIKLSHGTSYLNGYLEINLIKQGWHHVCLSSWVAYHLQNAIVACRQLNLGLPKEATSVYLNSSAEALSGMEFLCLGNEIRLQNCANTTNEVIRNCSEDQHVWLECSGFKEVKLRLSGRKQIEHGRVEIYHNGVWGTICDSDWTISDANVVCKTFLNSYAIDAYKSSQIDDDGDHPIFISDITCSGTEESILECSFRGLEDVHDCSHKDEVWVDCDSGVHGAGGRNVSASLITALSMVALALVLVIEYLALRRYQKWKADRRARQPNHYVRFRPRGPGDPHNSQGEINISETAAYTPHTTGVEYTADMNRNPVEFNQLLSVHPSSIMDDPPPPYASITQNGTNHLNEGDSTMTINEDPPQNQTVLAVET